jgi:hypothetical protein
VIFSGVVDPSRLEDLGAALADLDQRYSIELWNTERTEVIRELSG